MGAEARLGIAFTEGVGKRGMTLERFADITATNAAKIFGLYPRKGVIAPGSDADFALIDPAIRKTLAKEDFHVTDYSPWEGWQVTGWPVRHHPARPRDRGARQAPGLRVGRPAPDSASSIPRCCSAPSADRRLSMAGKLFEELPVGQVFQHQPGRTVTEADNVFFSCLTMNPQPLHVDFHAAAKAEFGKPLVNSLFTLGVAVGLSVGDTTLGTTVGNLGFDKVEFPKPVFHGDTIYSETEVVEKRESKSRPEWGIVTFEHRAKNQHGDLVMRCRRAAMMRRKKA